MSLLCDRMQARFERQCVCVQSQWNEVRERHVQYELKMFELDASAS